MNTRMNLSCIGIVGTGFVADLYMRSLKTFPEIRVVRAYDTDQVRLRSFCSHWNVSPALDMEAMLSDGVDKPEIILNLTNPASHFQVS